MKEESGKKINIKKKKSISPIYYGMAENTGETLTVFDVERGLSCGCICCSCGTRLEARKGEKRRHHFAHESNTECLYGAEIAIYQAMYELLRKLKQIYIPDATLRVGYYEERVIKKGRMLKLTDVKFHNDLVNYPPELFCYVGEKRFRVILNIESYYDVCDFSEIREYAKLNDISIMTIDIDDAGDASSFKSLQKSIDLPNNKWWIYNGYAEREERRFMEVAEQQKRIRQKRHEEKEDNYFKEVLPGKSVKCHDEKTFGKVTAFYGICPQCGKKLKEMASKGGKRYMCSYGCRIYVYRDSKTGEIVIREI